MNYKLWKIKRDIINWFDGLCFFLMPFLFLIILICSPFIIGIGYAYLLKFIFGL